MRTRNEIAADEVARLRFVAERDGYEKMLEFANRSKQQYKKAMRTPMKNMFRQQLLVSIIVFKNVLLLDKGNHHAM